MDHFQDQIKKLFEFGGFRDPAVHFDLDNRKIDVFLNEGEWIKKWIPTLVGNLEHIVRLFAKKESADYFYVDINNYRKDREQIIVELAKAAARKVVTESKEIRLPAMNAYERRLIHVELAVRPDVKTESEGEGKERCVVIRPIA
ncbi:MAG: R3H domain-containing nucleic acid-binding protein [Patescibacteria group bacterium]